MNPSVYYYGADNKRYIFPNEKTFKSWYSDFKNVKVLSVAEFSAILIGGNVTYRPGVKMVKIQTDSRVYAVAKGGVLRWVKTESLAKALYGNNWNKTIDDVSDAFFVNYTTGASIQSASDFNPTQAIMGAPDINIDKSLLPAGIATPAPSTPMVGCAYNNPVCPSGEQCVNNICKPSWKVKLDNVNLPNYQTSVDSLGSLVLQSGRYKVIIPDQSAEDYGKFRLNNIKACSEMIEERIGRAPYLGVEIVDKTIIDSSQPSGGSSCCHDAPNYAINNVFTTKEQFDSLAYSSSVYWKDPAVNYNSCLGGHEELHRFVFGTKIDQWANEGLAKFIENEFAKDPGTPAAGALIECLPDSFRAISFEGPVAVIPLRNVITGFNQLPRIYYYYTGACFWDYVEKNYGQSKFKELVSKLYEISSIPEKTFVKDAVVPTLGTSIWQFLNKIGISELP